MRFNLLLLSIRQIQKKPGKKPISKPIKLIYREG